MTMFLVFTGDAVAERIANKAANASAAYRSNEIEIAIGLSHTAIVTAIAVGGGQALIRSRANGVGALDAPWLIEADYDAEEE